MTIKEIYRHLLKIGAIIIKLQILVNIVGTLKAAKKKNHYRLPAKIFDRPL